MYQNYNYYPQQQQPSGQQIQQPQPIPNYLLNYVRPAQPQVNLKGRLVSSLEEARATSIDFDGSIFYFPDLANKQIYTKQINMDGTATLNVYELKELPTITKEQSVPSTEEFVTREEFNQVIAQLRTILNPEQQTVSPPPQTSPKQELKSF